MKRCSKCGIRKAPSQFYRAKKHGDGLQYECAACHRAEVSRWKEKRNVGTGRDALVLDNIERMIDTLDATAADWRGLRAGPPYRGPNRLSSEDWWQRQQRQSHSILP